MNLGGYHDQGGWFWRPFLPTENDAVGLIAQQVVSEMGGRFNELAFDADIVDRIAQAEKRNELIVVVVDAWTINVERYAALLRRYDQNSPQNSAVVVPWNDQDPETVRYSRKLRKRLGATLKSNTASLRFKLGASSSEDLREDLRSLLTDMQLNILGSASPEEPMATSSNQLLPVLPVPTEPI
jgi:FxsC-like protein